ncbi:MAG: peptidoglycan bridge formation glycyltransferase FemA/FemB family protein [Bacilli bacterium]
MEFRNLTEKEFKKISDNHPLMNFHQTIEWGNLKEKSGWKKHLVGIIDKKEIICASLLLEKSTPLKKSIFYAPRGPLIDFNNKELLIEFTKEIKKYIKENKGIFLKIDPYVINQERDRQGQVVPNQIDNREVVKTLKDLGYKHFGYNLYQETMQPRWIYTLNINNRSIEEILKDMDSKTRQIIRKNEKSSIICREITYDELPKFKDIMKHTGDRREFIDRPLSYYQNMYTSLKENESIKFLFAELHTKIFLKDLSKEIKELQKEFDSNKEKKESDKFKFNEIKFNKRQAEIVVNLTRLNNKIEDITKLKEQYGDVIVLGGIVFLINKNEVLSLYGGTYKEFMYLQSPYILHYEMIKYAVSHNCNRYNFYGITGDFKDTNPMYGLYLFKSGFGGEVTELIGEFDLIINKPYYYLYKISFYIYQNLKRLKAKIIK